MKSEYLKQLQARAELSKHDPEWDGPNHSADYVNLVDEIETLYAEVERLTKLRAVMDGTVSLGNFSYAQDNATGIWWTYWFGGRCCHDPGKWDYPLAFDCITDAVLWILEHGEEFAKKETPIRFPEGLPIRFQEATP